MLFLIHNPQAKKFEAKPNANVNALNLQFLSPNRFQPYGDTTTTTTTTTSTQQQQNVAKLSTLPEQKSEVCVAATNDQTASMVSLGCLKLPSVAPRVLFERRENE